MFNQLSVKLVLPQVIVGGLFVLALFFFADTLSVTTILFSVLFMILAQGIASYLYNSKVLDERIAKLKRYVEQVISTTEVPKAFVDNATDDLAIVSNKLIRFVDNLRDIMQELRAESEMLHQGAEELSGQISKSAKSVDNSTGQIEQMAESIELVASTSEILSQSVVQVTQTTGQVIEILEQGTKSSHTSQASISSFVKEVGGMAKDLALLQEQSARIGSVLDVIRGIADQTNLLALNAAIEAARAGEQGRGFAVVADEVRALAHRTQESTVEIQSMVEGLQEKSTNAVNAMSRGQAQTQDSLAHSEAVVEALEQIKAVFHEVDVLTSQIAGGTEEQQKSTTSLNKNMSKIVAISRDIHQGLSQASVHAEQQRVTTEQVDETLNKICV